MKSVKSTAKLWNDISAPQPQEAIKDIHQVVIRQQKESLKVVWSRLKRGGRLACHCLYSLYKFMYVERVKRGLRLEVIQASPAVRRWALAVSIITACVNWIEFVPNIIQVSRWIL